MNIGHKMSRLSFEWQLPRQSVFALPAILLLLVSAPLGAYNTIAEGAGSKWDERVHGTPATVSWSLMTPGVALGSRIELQNWSGTNSLGSATALDIRQRIDAEFGAGSFDSALAGALRTWASAARIEFVETPDPNAPMGEANTPDIRIGAFSFAPGDFAAGAGFGPPGDDISFPDALAGDLALNDQNRFTIAPGAEGATVPRDPQGFVQNDLQSLLLHELGHTLGLAHSADSESVMCGYIFPGDRFDGSHCVRERINRKLNADDIAGIQVLYGARLAQPHSVPFTGHWALVVLAIMLGFIARSRSIIVWPRRRDRGRN